MTPTTQKTIWYTGDCIIAFGIQQVYQATGLKRGSELASVAAQHGAVFLRITDWKPVKALTRLLQTKFVKPLVVLRNLP